MLYWSSRYVKIIAWIGGGQDVYHKDCHYHLPFSGCLKEYKNIWQDCNHLPFSSPPIRTKRTFATWSLSSWKEWCTYSYWTIMRAACKRITKVKCQLDMTYSDPQKWNWKDFRNIVFTCWVTQDDTFLNSSMSTPMFWVEKDFIIMTSKQTKIEERGKWGES